MPSCVCGCRKNLDILNEIVGVLSKDHPDDNVKNEIKKILDHHSPKDHPTINQLENYKEFMKLFI